VDGVYAPRDCSVSGRPVVRKYSPILQLFSIISKAFPASFGFSLKFVGHRGYGLRRENYSCPERPASVEQASVPHPAPRRK
jgi:hypothetical protein